MHFIDETVINEYGDRIIELPALARIGENKEKLKNVLKSFLSHNYIEKIAPLKNYLHFELDDNLINIILQDYGIDPKYMKKVNPLFKKSIVYFLEKSFQNKGNIEILQIFNEIFNTLFSAINFYRVIVVKKEAVVQNPDNPDQKIRKYLLTYELEPLYINDQNSILSSFDTKVSLTKNYLMSLDQYEDFKVFPVNTNLIYIQFTSAQINLDNFKYWNIGLKAYALTSLKNNFIDFRMFHSKTFNIEASDIMDIIMYLEYSKLRSQRPDFDFHWVNDKPLISLEMSKENIPELENFLHIYKNLNRADRREMSDFKRTWKLFVQQSITTERKFRNYSQLHDYILEYYPEIIDIQSSELFTDNDYINFYIDLYNVVISKLMNIPEFSNNNYILLFINSIFLAIITGQSFIENFFTPIYDIFKKYLFPVELDFLNKVAQTILIKDKFESFNYQEDIHMKISMGEIIDKIMQVPDKIKVLFLYKFKDFKKIEDKIKCNITSDINDSLKFQEKYKLCFKIKYIDDFLVKDNSRILLNLNNLDGFNKKDYSNIIINILNKDIKKFVDNQRLNIKINEKTKQKIDNNINDIKNIKVNSNFFDKYQSLNDQEYSKVNRFDYTKTYGDLSIYLSFYKEQYRKLSSFNDNEIYKNSNPNDYIYFDIHTLF